MVTSTAELKLLRALQRRVNRRTEAFDKARPEELDGRVLIDGGTVNPLPFDVLTDSCDLVIAVDINSGSPTGRGTVPGYFDTVFGSVQILQQAIVERELEAHPPDIYVKPDLKGFRTLQFYKADEIYRQAQPAKEELKRRLAEKL